LANHQTGNDYFAVKYDEWFCWAEDLSKQFKLMVMVAAILNR
jgi:hypothetical protein